MQVLTFFFSTIIHYQMIVNYMQSARTRFEQQQAERQKQSMVWQRRKQHTLAEMAIQEGKFS